MSNDTPNSAASAPSAGSVLPWLGLGFLGLVLAGVAALLLMRPEPAAVPTAVSTDPLLTLGQEVFIERCAICHGRSGVGDGPMARGITNPPVGNLTDGDWRHGSEPGEILAVVRDGVPNTQMQPFRNALEPRSLQAVTAYVLYLTGRPVPDELRKRPSSGAR
jgi:cytochrome c oxidase cbb3-type subunit 3